MKCSNGRVYRVRTAYDENGSQEQNDPAKGDSLHDAWPHASHLSSVSRRWQLSRFQIRRIGREITGSKVTRSKGRHVQNVELLAPARDHLIEMVEPSCEIRVVALPANPLVQPVGEGVAVFAISSTHPEADG